MGASEVGVFKNLWRSIFCTDQHLGVKPLGFGSEAPSALLKVKKTQYEIIN